MSRHKISVALLLQILLLIFTPAKSVPRVIDNEVLRPRPKSFDENAGFRKPFTLEESYSTIYRSFGLNGTWKTDTEMFYRNHYTSDFVTFDFATNTTKVLLNSTLIAQYQAAQVSFSYDDSFALFAYDVTAGFRHSTYKKFVVYDMNKQTFEQVANGEYLPLAKWSPTRNELVYVFEHDIYYANFSKEPHKVRRITNTGIYAVVYNGIPDWVYEEEVLGTASALWFSPDGRHLAFATFNDTEVFDAVFMYYGEPGALEDQYTAEVKIKYPKAGTRNPTVALSVVDLKDPKLKPVKLEAPIDKVDKDHILYTVTWWDDNRIVATWTNRVQNRAVLTLYDVKGNSKVLLIDEEPHGWVRVHKPILLPEDDYAILLKSQDSDTDAGRFLHVTRFKYDGDNLTQETDLTPGASEVHQIISVDRVRGRIYYLATAPDEPSQRNLYAVQLDGSRKPVCVSCSFVTPEGNNCTYANAAFSNNHSYYALTCSGPDPTVVAIFDANGKQVLTWEDNEFPRWNLQKRMRPLVKDLYVNANGYNSKVRLLLPPDFDETKKYPLIINVYAGPNTVKITEAANHGFESYMTTNRSVIYGWIDGRGSAFRGSKMLFEIYRRMGTVEVEDQITVTRILQETYPWIDRNRTGIWGWSYGGFATGMVLATDRNAVFKCGISVAPVTSWIYYDSIYTERYMGLPTVEDNLEGYNASAITNRVEGIRGKDYMLIHGTGDDNVHYQQAMELSKALVRKDIMFEQVSYTDEAHGLNGVTAHLYHTMDRFWANCLDLPHHH